jgi:hypothetical protein
MNPNAPHGRWAAPVTAAQSPTGHSASRSCFTAP